MTSVWQTIVKGLTNAVDKMAALDSHRVWLNGVRDLVSNRGELRYEERTPERVQRPTEVPHLREFGTRVPQRERRLLEKLVMQFPHCDMRVLHAPGECKYCDAHPEWQALREAWDINFTGEHYPFISICPAEMFRTVEKINAWPGNRPRTEGAEEIEFW